jgi:hypothetical protein
MNDATDEPKTHLRATDLRGAGRLAIDATVGLTNLVENLHHNIARVSAPLGAASEQPTTGITGLVYRSIRGVTRLVGGSLDALLGQVALLVQARAGEGGAAPSEEREAVIAALNGVLGDHLAATGNPLAIEMRLLHEGQALPAEPAALAAALPGARPRVLLLLHGLCMNPQQWRGQGRDIGATLAQEGGFTLLHLHYNTGLHVSTNGLLLADRLQALQRRWPVPLQELVIVGHSMGGLVARSACHQAVLRGHTWPLLLTNLFFLGTPHHGAPLERGGHWIDRILGASPYTAAFARLGRLRSAGITDLRHGSLLDEDRPAGVVTTADHRVVVPLPLATRCYAIAGSLGTEPGALREHLLGDGLVPVDSALGRHKQPARRLAFAPEHTWIGQGMGHLELMWRDEVLAQLRTWLLAPRAAAAVSPGEVAPAGTQSP